MRTKLPAAALAAILLSTSACLAQTANPDRLTRGNLTHDSRTRTYFVSLPDSYDKTKKHPLVLALHGGGGLAALFDRSTKKTLSAAADKRGVVIVYPQGIEGAWNDGRQERFAIENKTPQDDLGFLSKLIDVIHARYNTDPERTYATGISNGGFMSIRLAMDLSHKIAAIAPVTAQISQALADKTPALPTSVMIINGTADPLVPFEGGELKLFKRGRSRGTLLSTAASIERFRKAASCNPRPISKTLPDRDPNDGTRVKVETYTGGNDSAEVVLVRIIGGGHTWPGGTQYLGKRLIGKVCRDINASELILDFLLKHKRKATPKAH